MNWIGRQMDGTSVTCVLIGSQTVNSRWIKYEIEQSIEKGNGLLGMYIHNVKDKEKSQVVVYTDETSIRSEPIRPTGDAADSLVSIAVKQN